MKCCVALADGSFKLRQQNEIRRIAITSLNISSMRPRVKCGDQLISELIYLTKQGINVSLLKHVEGFYLKVFVFPFKVTCKFGSRDYSVSLRDFFMNTNIFGYIFSESTPLESRMTPILHVYFAICLFPSVTKYMLQDITTNLYINITSAAVCVAAGECG